MSNHTPGPWRVNSYGAIEQRKGATLGRLDGATSEEAAANNRIAAAAPEMLEALYDISRRMNQRGLDTADEMRRIARAAIAKVER